MLPEDSGKAIVQAHTVGLKALVELLRERTIKETKYLHSKAQERFDIAFKKWERSFGQGRPDFSPVADQEKGLRDLELENIWETTAGYGNTETKRMRSEREGRIGPLNGLINVFGAKLRDYFLLMYPLDTPVEIGQQKRKTIWGYFNDEYGRVPVAHGADLAELDLADMIRSHGRELCRKSFIFGVPSSDFDSYALLLIRRLTPFVDYIYTDTKLGSSHFLRPRTSVQEKCADEILREIVDELNSLYAIDSSKQVFPSRVRTDDGRSTDEKFFQFQITELRQASKKASKEEAKKLQTWARFLKKLTSKKKPKLRAKDARHLYDIVRNKARYEGIRYHNLIIDGLPQAYSAESIILRGDRFLKPGEDYLLVGESRLGTAEGPGRIDLGLFTRTAITNPKKPGQLVVMKPVAVFDIKTRTSFDWEIRTKKSKGKRKKTVPKFLVWKRGMTDEEWNDALAEVPEDDDAHQLGLYADGLVREYRRLTRDESVSDILKGVVLLDTQFDAGLNRSVVRSLLNVLLEDNSLRSKLKRCDRLLIRSRDLVAQRSALVLHTPAESQFSVLESERNPNEVVHRYDPFSEVQDTNSKHVLYLSARSASSSGFTAAWLGQYWHGLHHLQKLSSEQDDAPVTWLDLSGEFGDDDLAKIRLRIPQHGEDIQTFFDRIRIIDLSQRVEQFLFRGGSFPEIEPLLTKGIVVVSGWQWIEDSLPPRLRQVLEELERYMVQEISKTGNTSVWFLQPRPDERTSTKYHSRCLLPFWDSSEHRNHVTNIVWNLPVRPYTSAQTTPMLDDLRVIVEQTTESVERNLIEIPILENWSARFWSKKSKRTSKKTGQTENRGRDALSAKDIIGMEELSKELIKDSMDLIPWLCALHPTICERGEGQDITLSPQVIPLYGETMKRKSIMTRVRYRAKLRATKGTRSYVSTQQLIPKQTITHPRHYRQFRRKKRRAVNTQTYRAPDEVHLEYKNLREQTARNVENRRLRQMMRFFSSHKESWTREGQWLDLLRQLDSLLPDTRKPVKIEELYKISELFMNHELTSDLWDSMVWFRERRLGDGLRSDDEEHLSALLESRPYVVTLFGNYLFLLLVALLMKYSDLRIDQLQNLWLVVKSWQLKQIGFFLRDVRGMSRPKFDVRAVWSNLSMRASVMSQIPLPVQSAVRHGQLLVVPTDFGYDYWLFIEDQYNRDRLHSGLWIGQNPLVLTSSMKWAEANHTEIAERASNARPEAVHDLVIGKIDGVEYIWFFQDDRWNLQGELLLIPRMKDAITSIRGLQVRPAEGIDSPTGIDRPSTIKSRVHDELIELAQLRQHIRSVNCELEIESGMYVITFESDEEILDRRVFNRTSDVISILRSPVVEGVPLQSSRNSSVYLTWSPYRDIDYGELQLLRPYVERKTPFVLVNVPLPLTCSELLDQPPIETDVTVLHDESACPLVDGTATAHGHCWRIESDISDLSYLEDSHLTDVDVSSLIRSEEIFLEGRRCSLNISFGVDPKERKGIVFRESKRIARALNMKPLNPGTFLNIDLEQLHVVLTSDYGGIQISVFSSITGERVSSGALIPPGGKWDIDDIVESFVVETDEFLESYFDNDEELEERIIDYQEMLEDLRNKLRRIKKGLPPY